jgi:drug/metabolite transporter superfamily protein YnfA
VYVAFIVLIPIGGGLAISGIVRREFGWLITLIGVVAVVVTSVMQIKTEEGIVSFGIIAAVFGAVFLLMGLQILRQDME